MYVHMFFFFAKKPTKNLGQQTRRWSVKSLLTSFLEKYVSFHLIFRLVVVAWNVARKHLNYIVIVVNEFMFVHFKGNNDFTLLLIQISFRFANDNNYYVFFFMATRRFQFSYISDVYKWFARYLCSAHTCSRAGRQLKTEQLGKTASKARKEQRERERESEEKQKSMWERILGHSLTLSLARSWRRRFVFLMFFGLYTNIGW